MHVFIIFLYRNTIIHFCLVQRKSWLYDMNKISIICGCSIGIFWCVQLSLSYFHDARNARQHVYKDIVKDPQLS